MDVAFGADVFTRGEVGNDVERAVRLEELLKKFGPRSIGSVT